MLRQALDSALESAFMQSGLPAEWKSPTYRQDTGDGCILVLPPARTWRLVDPLIRLLDEELHSYEQQRQRDDPPLLVRVSVHVGPMPESNLADAINDVARFVDSDAVRAGIAAASAHGSYTALALSDEMYRRVVLARRSRLLPERDFLAAPATVPGKGFTRTAWIHVPRLSPSVVAQYLEKSEAPAVQEEAKGTTAPVTPSGIQVSGNVNINTLADNINTLRTRQINHASRASDEGQLNG
ncbi:hypothetical protein [Kitasatospora sp. MAP5-34]|uniref:hypothetical protein n=1 Tax=Kitasatospora sp. MAP5-34 TaxID=3035102 RepID=UPI0024740F01|nr:hypothetical protein [Kitasatospora sp. MAP5-34]